MRQFTQLRNTGFCLIFLIFITSLVCGEEEGVSHLTRAINKNDLKKVKKLYKKKSKSGGLSQDRKNKYLLTSVKKGKPQIVQFFLRKGADIEAEDNNGNTPLMYALKKCHKQIVDLLLRNGAKVEKQMTHGGTPLAIACYACHDKSVITKLIESGADLNLQINGHSILMYASRAGNNKAVKVLLEHGAEVGVRLEGKTALLHAAENGHAETVDILLKHGADPDVQMKSGETPLMIAAENGHAEMVDILLKHGADPEIQSKSGKTPLMFAAGNGNSNIIKHLLENGASKNVRDKFDMTALRYASGNAHLNSVQMLFAKGGELRRENINHALISVSVGTDEASEKNSDNEKKKKKGKKKGKKGKKGKTSDRVRIARMLIQKGADVNTRLPDNVTPLLSASMAGHTEIVRILLNNGAKINQPDLAGHPLIPAIWNGHRKIANILIKNGANVNVTYKDGTTPLMEASKTKHIAPDFLKKLIKEGAKVQAKDKKGETALLKAARKGNKKKVKVLLNHGADPFVAFDHLDRTDKVVSGPVIKGYPYEVAVLNRHNKTASILMEYMMNNIGEYLDQREFQKPENGKRIKQLIEKLASEDSKQVKKAENKLKKIGDKALYHLKRNLNHKKEQVRNSVEYLLFQLLFVTSQEKTY